MKDTLEVVAILTSLLQAAANASAAAMKVSAILEKLHAEGRDKMTAEEWAEIDSYVDQARDEALESVK